MIAVVLHGTVGRITFGVGLTHAQAFDVDLLDKSCGLPRVTQSSKEPARPSMATNHDTERPTAI